MSPAVFLDANVPIYASGRDHAYKEPCARVLMMAAERPLSFVTDAEVLQELVHRYLALRRWTLGREVVKGFAEVMHDRIEPVFVKDIVEAASLADLDKNVSARDLVHAAVMRRLGIERIISSDTDFDRLPGITRLDPINAVEWEKSVLMEGGG